MQCIKCKLSLSSVCFLLADDCRKCAKPKEAELYYEENKEEDCDEDLLVGRDVCYNDIYRLAKIIKSLRQATHTSFNQRCLEA